MAFLYEQLAGIGLIVIVKEKLSFFTMKSWMLSIIGAVCLAWGFSASAAENVPLKTMVAPWDDQVYDYEIPDAILDACNLSILSPLTYSLVMREDESITFTLPAGLRCPTLPRKVVTKNSVIDRKKVEMHSVRWYQREQQISIDGVALNATRAPGLIRSWSDFFQFKPSLTQVARLADYWIVDTEATTAVFDVRNKMWCEGTLAKSKKEANVPTYYWIYNNTMIIQVYQASNDGPVTRRGLDLQKMCGLITD